MMFWSDNPIADFNRYDREREAEEARYPKCDNCGEPMFEHYYDLGDIKVCPECITEYRCEVEL